MEYRKIISVTGLTGLYELVGSKKDGAIVRSLDDKITKFVSERIHNFSHLESVEVYTVGDNVNLTDVFLAMKNNSEPLPGDKDAAAVKAYFKKVYPDMDFDRVYASDMKKMVKWFSILQANDVEIKASEQPAEDEDAFEDAEVVEENSDAQAGIEEQSKIEAPAATEAVAVESKSKAKAAKPKAESTQTGEDLEKKPTAKKAAKKKDD